MSRPVQQELGLVDYVVKVAKAVAAVGDGTVSYGTYYVAEVTFGFEGEDVSDIRIVTGEHGDLAIEFGREDSVNHVEIVTVGGDVIATYPTEKGTDDEG